MIFDVVVTLPDGHTWQGEVDIDDADLEDEDGDIDLHDDEVRAYVHTTIAEWLLQEQIDWRWAKKPV